MPLSDEEQKLRLTGMGASEVSTLLGINPHETLIGLWLRKTGRAEPAIQSAAADWGNILEPVVGKRWADLHGVELVKGTTLRHPTSPHVLATPDFLVGDDAVLECKTTGSRMAHLWSAEDDGVPAGFLVQVQMQLAVTARQVWNIAALIGGQEWREHSGQSDPETQAGLIDLVEAFWRNHVEADIPPPVDASDESRRWLASRNPESNGKIRKATPEEAELLASFRIADKSAKEAKEAAELLKAKVCDAIGADDGLECSFGKATFRIRHGYQVPAHEVRTARVFRPAFKEPTDA